jgi:small-conductance mechanosensitive channel
VQVFAQPVTLAGVVSASVVLVVSFALALVLRRLIARYSVRRGESHRATWYTVSRIATYTVLAVGVVVAISALGISMNKLAVLAGGLGIGLGFGLQTIFSNFISGLILLFDKSVKVGDYVELASGVTGEVRDIKIRATRIVTNDNIDILVPNSEFTTARVVNWTHREVSRRLRVPFGVAYGTDKEVVKGAALEAAAELPFTLALEGPRRPQVWLVGFGDSSLDFELVVWLGAEATKRPAAVQAAYNWALHSALQRHDIEIPFPQQDLNVRRLFGLEEADARRALGLGEAAALADAGPEVGRAPTPAAKGDATNDAVDDVSGPASRYADEVADQDTEPDSSGSRYHHS